MTKTAALRKHFNVRALTIKGATLLAKEIPCVALAGAAGFIGIPGLSHNPVLELGIALGGAVAGEYVGGKIFKSCVHEKGWKAQARRYGLSLVFGVATWGLHQKLLHRGHEHEHEHHEHHGHRHGAVAKPAYAVKIG